MPDNTSHTLRTRRGRIAACAALGFLLAGCSTTNRPPTDTGSMALPQPMAPGILSTTTGSTGTAAQPRDTGNMAYPAPLPQGNVGTTRVR